MVYRKSWVFTSACVGMFLFGCVMLSLGSISSFIVKKLAIDELAVATLTVALPTGILLGSLIFGPVVDRFGYQLLLIICSAFILIAFEIIAYAGSLRLFQIAFFLVGFGGGAINGGTNALVADISSGEKVAKLSLLGVSYGIGALGMPAIMGFLSHYFSYEKIVAGFGWVVLIPIILFIFVKYPEPKQKKGFPIKSALLLLTNLNLLLIGFFLFFQSGIEGLINNWTALYLQRIQSIHLGNSLLALSAMVIGLTIARLLIGTLLRNIRPYRILLSCIGILFGGLIIIKFSSSYAVSIIGLSIAGFGIAAGFPILLGYVGELFPDLSGTAFGIVLVIALVGNILLNYVMGIIANHYGLQQLIPFVMICLGASLLIVLIILSRISKEIRI